MKRNWFSIFVIFVLAGLLVGLATLQYKWVGQIAESERTRLNERLGDDTNRFAQEFNREIQQAFFSFQLDKESFESRDWTMFFKRYAFWKSQTKYPSLVKDLVFIENKADTVPLKYNVSKGSFEEQEWTPELKAIEARISGQGEFNSIVDLDAIDEVNGELSVALERQLALVSPVFSRADEAATLIVHEEILPGKKIRKTTQFKFAERYGVLIVLLDEKEISGKLLPKLVEKYFSSNESGDYRLSVADSNDNIIFQTHEEEISSTDSTARVFSLTATDFAFFSKKVGNVMVDSHIEKFDEVVHETVTDEGGDDTFSVDIKNRRRAPELDGKEWVSDGIWTLKVQHIDGSLEKFIVNTRRRNLGISFGILLLMAVSMGLILLSSQRAKLLAQRQLDFVSSVSHEFRTPLSVIYSAGENLSDGVIEEQSRISSYGTLIKREGKKLSGMVEQILEFAGAQGGTRKFDFRETDVAEVVKSALAECELVIREKGFEIEMEIDESLPAISADKIALTQALQNLISNSLKYSNGKRKVLISAKRVEKGVEIAVKDNGLGISKADLKYIFEPFYRSESVVDEQISGNGLGLSLVEQIVDAHDGEIVVDSETGRGSTFTIQLPASIDPNSKVV